MSIPHSAKNRKYLSPFGKKRYFYIPCESSQSRWTITGVDRIKKTSSAVLTIPASIKSRPLIPVMAISPMRKGRSISPAFREIRCSYRQNQQKQCGMQDPVFPPFPRKQRQQPLKHPMIIKTQNQSPPQKSSLPFRPVPDHREISSRLPFPYISCIPSALFAYMFLPFSMFPSAQQHCMQMNGRSASGI